MRPGAQIEELEWAPRLCLVSPLPCFLFDKFDKFANAIQPKKLTKNYFLGMTAKLKINFCTPQQNFQAVFDDLFFLSPE